MKNKILRRTLFVVLAFFLMVSNSDSSAQNKQSVPPDDWLTRAEATDYEETARYDKTIKYAERLDAASGLIRFTSFGQSAQNRSLPLLIAAANNTFTPQAARRAGKAIVLIQACIHPGEPDGKDAGLALLRDIAITKTRSKLLDRVVILFIPIYNTDGHERFNAYNRINQNGPREMGWRGTATRLNLNRDFMKTDAPETRAWLRLWNEWSPDLFIDCHVTDGADFQYNVTYQYEAHGNVARSVSEWSKRAFDERIVPQAERASAGNLFSPYLVFRDNREPSKGVETFISSPRFATGYVPIVRNRPALLIETHMIKPYRSRVRGTYDLLVAALEEANARKDELLNAVRVADEETIAAGRAFDAAKQMPLNVQLTERSVPRALKAVEFKTELSNVSGAHRVIYGTKPIELTVPFYSEARVVNSTSVPLYYIVPAEWRDVIEILSVHGLKMQRLSRDETIEVESYRFRDVKWASAAFEGRLPVIFKTDLVRARRSYRAGSIVVSMAQPNARAATHLLEPSAPDSLVTWGFFNPIFEQKEYGEDYVLEKLAREMLAKDESLRREFERKLADDPKFAASARERLRFFYERSPYWDKELNLYPVGRIMGALAAPLVPR